MAWEEIFGVFGASLPPSQKINVLYIYIRKYIYIREDMFTYMLRNGAKVAPMFAIPRPDSPLPCA
jgi:hypothetical protein